MYSTQDLEELLSNKNNKKLVFVHTPKCGGTYVRSILSHLGIQNKGHSHYTQNDKISFTVIRNPVEARASYFNFIYHMYLDTRKEYNNIPTMREKFLYYLFEDKNFLIHNNYQSRFLCNPSDARSWDRKSFFEIHSSEMFKKYQDGAAFDWFVGDDNTSLDLAINNISNFEIKNTVDRLDLFLKSISEWFLLNHGLQIKFNQNEKTNESLSSYNGVDYSSKDLIDLLTEEEISRILYLNSIDYAVYNFVKEQEKDD